jgi:F0F1-type ATP synthase membrane subunit b/b'
LNLLFEILCPSFLEVKKAMPESSDTVGAKLKYSLPAIILALVLAIGISYLITYLTATKPLEEFKKETKDNFARVEKSLDDAKKDLGAKLDAQGAQIKDLQAATKSLGEKLDSVGKQLGDLATGYEKFRATTEKTVAEHGTDITETKGAVNKLDTRVVYIEQKIKLVDQLVVDVGNLQKDTTGLKEQAAALRADLTTTSKKAEITDRDLTELSDKVKLFQLRVLAARAREAAEAARNADLKTLLSRLEDVGSEK